MISIYKETTRKIFIKYEKELIKFLKAMIKELENTNNLNCDRELQDILKDIEIINVNLCCDLDLLIYCFEYVYNYWMIQQREKLFNNVLIEPIYKLMEITQEQFIKMKQDLNKISNLDINILESKRT